MTQRWGGHKIRAGEAFRFQAGDLTLWFRQEGDEVLVASVYGGDSRAREPELSWSRWVMKEPQESLTIQPFLPDRPVVVGPENPFHLGPGTGARIFVPVPLWVGVSAGTAGAAPFAEYPTRVLSQSWFGEFEDGELCYWITTKARRDAAAMEDRETSACAVAPIRITNHSAEDLPVQRICLRVRTLDLYENGERFWAGETQVNYQGGDTPSEVRNVPGAPPEAKGGKLKTKARQIIKENFAARTFRSLQKLTDLIGD